MRRGLACVVCLCLIAGVLGCHKAIIENQRDQGAILSAMNGKLDSVLANQQTEATARNGGRSSGVATPTDELATAPAESGHGWFVTLLLWPIRMFLRLLLVLAILTGIAFFLGRVVKVIPAPKVTGETTCIAGRTYTFTSTYLSMKFHVLKWVFNGKTIAEGAVKKIGDDVLITMPSTPGVYDLVVTHRCPLSVYISRPATKKITVVLSPTTGSTA